MSILKRPSTTSDVQPIPHRHRWSADGYMKAGSSGLLGMRRTELIDGEIYDVPSQKNPHVAAVSNLTRMLIPAFDETFWVSIQSTVRLPQGDVPEPDFAIRPGPATSDDTIHPLPLLVIEVSDESLLHDQTIKAGMYAGNRIQEYWIVNVKDRQLEVYRDPIEDSTRRSGWKYGSVSLVRAPEYVTPLCNPPARIDVERIFR